MPFQVHLSQIKDREAFEKEVHNHISRLKAFNFQVGKPRPTSHPIIEGCIKRVRAPGKADHYEPDYEIIDDSDAAKPLEERKQIFHALIQQLEIEAKNKVLAPRKARLLNIQYAEATQRIGIAQMEAAKNDEPVKVDEADKSLVAYVDSMRAKYQAIELKGATAEAALEELTEEAIDSWQPPTFD